jgi:hypothetical protein
MTRCPSVLQLSVVGALVVCLAGCNRSVVVVFDVPGGVSAVSVDGDRVFLAGNPRQPDLRVVRFPSEQAGRHETVATGVFGPSRVGALEVQGSTAFAALSSGLLVLDVSDAASPQVLATLDQNAPRGSWRSLAVSDGLVVLAHSRGALRDRGVSMGLSLIDVRDPSAPRPISAITLPQGSDNVADITLRGPLLLVAARRSGLFIYDVTDPPSPRLLSQYRPGHWTRGVASEGGVAYLSVSMTKGASRVHVLDISDPSDPQLIKRLETPGVAQRLAVSFPYLYVADRQAGLRIYDISTPAEPRFISRFRFRGNVMEVAASDALVVIWGRSPVKILRHSR